jgi:hypothetical protein
VDADERLDHFSLTPCPAALPENILPTQVRPPAHKPDIIILLEPRLVSHTSSRRRYSVIRKIQRGEWKYCTDGNLKDGHLITEKCTPLANAFRSKWPCTHVDIVPTVMSRTGTPHSLTHTNITTLINPGTDPLDKPSNTPTRDTTCILSRLHIHTVQWLHHLLRIYRIKVFTTYKQVLHSISNPTFPCNTTPNPTLPKTF